MFDEVIAGIKMQYRKILFVIDVMNPGGGAQKVLPYLLRILQKNGAQVRLIVLKKTAEVVPLDDLDVDFILPNIETRLLENSFKILDTLTQKSRDFELICSFMDFITCYFVALSSKLTQIPYYAFVRCEPSFVVDTFSYRQVNHELYSLCLQNAQKVICNSKSSLMDITKNFGVSREKTFLLYNPINMQQIQKELNKNMELPTKKQGEIFCISVGRLYPQKNYLTLLKSFLKLQDLQIRLFIIGEGEQRIELEKFMSDYHLSNIALLGYQDNIYSFLEKADIFIHASLYEGFPNVVLEAACLRKPLILSNIMPHKDFFATKGALFFNTENADDLATKIRELACNQQKRERLAKEAFSVMQDYQGDIFEKQLQEIFNIEGSFIS